MSAHLVHVKNRSWQRVARIRIYMGTLTQGWQFPPRAEKNSEHGHNNINQISSARASVSFIIKHHKNAIKIMSWVGIDHFPYRCLSVGSGVAIYDHRSVANTDTCPAPNKQGRTCMAPRVDGARAGPLANTLFGAKHGGHRHRQCASTFPSFRRQMLRNSWTSRLWLRLKNRRFSL